MSEDTYSKHMERHGDVYQPKMREILEGIRQEALRRGYLCDEPWDMTADDCYRWTILIQPAGTATDEDEGVDVTLQIAESQAYGDGEEGLNFMLDVVHYGGAILGGLAPFNYSPQVWVAADDNEAVKDRWDLFSNAFDADVVLATVEEYYAEKAA